MILSFLKVQTSFYHVCLYPFLKYGSRFIKFTCSFLKYASLSKVRISIKYPYPFLKYGSLFIKFPCPLSSTDLCQVPMSFLKVRISLDQVPLSFLKYGSHARTHTHTHTHAHTYAFAHTHAHTHIHTHTHTHNKYTQPHYKYTQPHARARTHAHMNTLTTEHTNHPFLLLFFSFFSHPRILLSVDFLVSLPVILERAIRNTMADRPPAHAKQFVHKA